MRIVALYKTWDGGEWIGASLRSIYEHVDAIVLVHSARSWLGEPGNTARQVAVEWARRHDAAGKMRNVDVDSRTQEEQYAVGVKHIREAGLNADVVMAVDADEIWNGEDIARAVAQIGADQSRSPAYRVNMHTYLRTPFYRVDPPYGSPTTFFRRPELLTQSPRGCRAPAAQLDNVWMHHFSYVRATPDDVWRKIRQSCVADRDEVIVEDWMESVWKHLPGGANLHAFARWRSVWGRILCAWWSDLPAAARESEFIKRFWPESLLLEGERNALYELACGRRQAVDLGTFRGSSAVVLSLACDRVETIDLFEGVLETNSHQHREEQYRELWLKHRHTVESTRETLSWFGNITQRRDDTAAAAGAWPDRSVDFLFVDADHSHAGTMANVTAWLPKLVRGGRIALHDNNEIHPGVMRAVDDLRTLPHLRTVDLPRYSGSLAAFDVT